MRAGSTSLDAARAGRFIIVAGAAILLCAVARAEVVSSLTNTVSLQDLVQRARGGQTDAIFSLANFLASRGDLTNAAGWYRAGAERGDTKSQQAFAQCLAAGCGVATNLAEAARWSALAVKATGSNAVAETKAKTNTLAGASQTRASAPATNLATNTSSTVLHALFAAISPAPLKVAAREVPSAPMVPPVSGNATNAAAFRADAPTANTPAGESEPTRWRIPPEDVGDGIHFPRATNLPPLTPTVQDEPAVVRPPGIFR